MEANLILEEVEPVSAIAPVDLSGAANNGDWVSMKSGQRLMALLFKGAGTAGDDPVFTLKQATDNAGTSAKALNFTTIYSKVGTLTAVGTWTKTTQAAGNTYTDTVSAESQAMIAVEITAAMLDRDNGFDYVQLSIPDVGANAQLGCAIYLLGDLRFETAPENRASQIA